MTTLPSLNGAPQPEHDSVVGRTWVSAGPRRESIPQVMSRVARGTGGLTFTDSKLRTQRVSYRELVHGGKQAASGLAAAGIGHGDTVCFLSRTEADLVKAMLGAWELGAIPNLHALPRRIDQGLVDEVDRRVRTAEAKAVIASDETAEQMQTTGLSVPLVPFRDLNAPQNIPLTEKVAQHDIALLQFTSGTTSLPRAVPVTHRQFLDNTTAVASVLAPRPSDVLVMWLPLYHDMGIISLIGTMMEGNNVVVMSPDEFLRRPGAWLEALHAFGGTATVAPNFAYGLVARDLMRRKPKGLDLSRVRCAMNGAEPIDLDALDAFADAARPYDFEQNAICPMYGQAEATLAVTVTSPDEPLQDAWVDRSSLEPGEAPKVLPAGSPNARRLAACGQPIADTELRVVDEDGSPLPEGTVGQIAICGPGVMSAYLFEPGATDDKIVDGWLLSGDLGFELADQWYICGRMKDMMIVGGRNLYPEDYESIADHVPGVRFGHTAAFSLPDTEKMVLLCEIRGTSDRGDAIASDVLEAVRDRLRHAPHRVVIVPGRSLPRTSSGKRQRSACRQLYRNETLTVLGEA